MSKTMLDKADSGGETSINSITQSSSSLRTPLSSETSQEITHPFACFRCPKRFSSWHALGGHQNAHKKERNEEHRLYNERRLAMKKQSPVTIPLPKPPLPIVQQEVAVLTHYSPVASYGLMVQMQSLGPGSIYSYDGPQAPVFMAGGGFEYGPTTRTGVKGEGCHPENENSRRYEKPVNTKVMALNLFWHEERDFGPFAVGLINEGREDADDESISKEEVDLTLRL